MTRHLSLAAIVAILALATLSCSPAKIDSRIVGTWEWDLELNMAPTFGNMLKRSGSAQPLDDALREAKERRATTGEQPNRETFAADGTYISEGFVLGHSTQEVARWTLIDDAGQAVTLDIVDNRKGHEGETWHRTIVFETSDVIRERNVLGETWSRRVK